ncbi:hypothetical protein ACGFNU_33840 [Spirillospora sp. NPDC048911]
MLPTQNRPARRIKRAARVDDLTLIPGTRSLWATGSVKSDAAIYRLG